MDPLSVPPWWPGLLLTLPLTETMPPTGDSEPTCPEPLIVPPTPSLVERSALRTRRTAHLTGPGLRARHRQVVRDPWFRIRRRRRCRTRRAVKRTRDKQENQSWRQNRLRSQIFSLAPCRQLAGQVS